MSMLPVLGNLAWAPVSAIENVEVLDRFNGVPTFGIFSVSGERQLFWRVTGYVPREYSIWLYMPLTPADESRLADAEPSDLLDGLAFRSGAARYSTVGIARDYRLVFEREWQIPPRADARDLFGDLLRFLRDALTIALREDMPPARRELVYTASEAIRELADA
ncbi:MAG: hypothetical protein FWE35_27965 [Streptosporangiales bacterium]|nr:hypothetical protein [Streptosporangiales bacterium]